MEVCQFCQEKELLDMKDNMYCSNCESYFINNDGVQEHVFVPVEEIDQVTLYGNVCFYCEKLYKKEIKISCINFKEYYAKLLFCKKCKERNFKFIKNTFHKNFVLYKTKQRTCSGLYIFLFLLIFLLISKYCPVFSIIAIFCFEVKIKSNYSICKTILISLIYFIAFKFIVFGYFSYTMLTDKKISFKVPQNLEDSPDIVEHIKFLSISNPKKNKDEFIV
ncbi:hypothetical protein NGRA_0587 [Nosema granulosis]|uniref:Uncharacterized protein n=1 Tax=Nosema granulosis TaxID=83296 RepID=A0A9P6H1Q2_9MICR|nr:hypothetical protein NGRA_0587 [Nosema granulosis]